MKYTMVKQFSNAAIDNLFIFFWKFVDFGKLMIEVFWGLFDIFAAFFLIFYNVGMYFYYLFLFMIDRGSEGGAVTIATRKHSPKTSKIPSVHLDKTPAPIPAMFRVKTPSTITGNAISSTVNVAAKTTETVQNVLKPLKPAPSGAGAKKSIIKSVLEFIADIFIAIKDIIVKPFTVIRHFLTGKLTPVREGEARSNEATAKGSLIDDYLKEYEKQRKRK